MSSQRERPPAITLRGHKEPVISIAAPPSANSLRLASGAEDGTARIWDLTSQRCIQGLKGFASGSEVSSLTFADENLLYAAAGVEVRLFDLRTPSLVLTQSNIVGPVATDEINSIAINKQQTQLASASDSGEVSVIDLRTLRPFKRLRSSHSSLATCVAFRSTKPWELWSGAMDSTLIRWDYSKGSAVETIDMAAAESVSAAQSINPPFVHCMAFSEDARILAAGFGDGNLALLQDVKKGKTVTSQVERVEAHSWSVTCLQFPTINGTPTVFTASLDGTLARWSVNSTDKLSPSLDERINIHRKANCLLLLKNSHSQASRHFACIGGSLLDGSSIAGMASGDIELYAI
ncbi:WD40-repeat-containing domain protein [Phlyctochytrium arcticum]|nr:WD40-repeat-containing domain protein [Phlyctochytrium arcticum]